MLAVTTAAPFILPSGLRGQDAPSKQITVGIIGVGWWGTNNLNSLLAVGGCRVVAVCDVDDKHLQSGMDKVNNKYKDKDCKGYKDFREVIARKDIDAVTISTPDNWHALVAIAAAKAGKDIYCEKPLSLSLGEGTAVVKAVSGQDIIWQTGSWQRSQATFRWAVQIVQNGYLGKISRVEVGLPNAHSDFEKTGPDLPDGPVPDGVGYEMWTGPAQMLPFNPSRFHKNWRWNNITVGGQLMDRIGHHCDIAHWGLANPEFGIGPDDSVGPLEVSATAVFPDVKATWNTATKYRIECKYPKDIEVVIAGGHNDIKGGVKWIGPNGWVSINRGDFKASDPEWIREIQAREKIGDLDIQLFKSLGHHQEWIDCIKACKRTITPVEVAHRSQTPGHLGYIAAQTGDTLKWDAAKHEIVGNPTASKLITREICAPWSL